MKKQNFFSAKCKLWKTKLKHNWNKIITLYVKYFQLIYLKSFFRPVLRLFRRTRAISLPTSTFCSQIRLRFWCRRRPLGGNRPPQPVEPHNPLPAPLGRVAAAQRREARAGPQQGSVLQDNLQGAPVHRRARQHHRPRGEVAGGERAQGVH